jgi:SPP1 family predicted phage head-tail adaptor
MQAGKLRHRITIQRRTVTYNAMGHESGSWQSIETRYSRVKELSGTELERARQLVPEVTHQITLRRSNALYTDRILFRGRTLQIASITNDEIGSEQTILAVEIKPTQ